jgi:hypothetical protein
MILNNLYLNLSWMHRSFVKLTFTQRPMSTKLLRINGLTNLPSNTIFVVTYRGIIECAKCNLESYLMILWSN